MQLELFNDTEVMSDEEIIKMKAKEYTAKSIFRSSGHRGEIKRYLEIKDKKGAFESFNRAFRTYGFGHGKYSFLSTSGKGKVTIDHKLEFEVTSKELFDILLNSVGY